MRSRGRLPERVPGLVPGRVGFASAPGGGGGGGALEGSFYEQFALNVGPSHEGTQSGFEYTNMNASPELVPSDEAAEYVHHEVV